MDDRRPKGRGRARGQRPSTQQEQSRPSSYSQERPPPAQSGAWGHRPGSSQQPQVPYSRQPTSQQSVSRGTQRGDTAVPGPSRAQEPQPMEYAPIGAGASASAAEGGGGDASSTGRGALRGRRIVTSDILNTKPLHVKTKQGTSGRPIMLTANYFKLLTTTDWCLYQYRVDFAPEEDRTVIRKSLLRVHKEKLGAYIFDGTVLYTSHRLPENLEVMSTRTSDDTHIRITIKFVGDMVQGDYHYLQFFNIIMRKCLEHLKLQLVGRNYFDARNKLEVREYALELWPGYVTSIRQHEHDILLCTEITHKVMRQQTLYDILSECHRKYGDDFKTRFTNQVIGLVVLTDYNNNTYRIDDVDFDASPMSTFERKDGPITYAEYYRSRYDIRIRSNTQPMLVSRSRPRDRRAGQSELVYLVPELCRATGLTDEMRNQFHLMRAIDTHTRLNPEMRTRRLMAFNERLRSERNVVDDLSSWNLNLDRKLIEVPARVLDPEKIIFARKVNIIPSKPANWTIEQRNQGMVSSVALKEWVLLCTNRCKRDAQNFVGLMGRVATGLQFQLGHPIMYELRDDRPGSYTNALEDIMSRSTPELVFCVVPNNSQDRYSAIKKKCCVDRPVPSQVFLQKNLSSKGAMTIATKVVIQINCKLGGAAWAVDIPASGLMVVGFDVCHDTNMKNRDFGAMVASLDNHLTRYFSAVSAHTTGEELSNDLAMNICKAIQKYREVNNSLPNRIVIYRDGVGEGQIPYVNEHEVKTIKEKLAQLYGSADAVHMAFILVNKRINTRLFKGRYNPDPGTVVDDVITNPVKYDFFLVSQSVDQGTVSPTAYSVLEDSLNLNPDRIQRLTYKMTHLYYNLSSTIRVPAPCQYAHKLAFLVAQHIHRPPSSQLESLLYYI